MESGRQSCHIGCVSAKKSRAWIVLVRTERFDFGEPILVGYIAGYPDRADAIEAVHKHEGLLEGSKIVNASEVSEATAGALGVIPGAVWML